jgi:hypothetical protein
MRLLRIARPKPEIERQPASQDGDAARRSGRQTMNIIDLATRAGLLVLLDARIGNETYHSVCGSLAALQRFADAIGSATQTVRPLPNRARRRRRPVLPRGCATLRRKRARRSGTSRTGPVLHGAMR